METIDNVGVRDARANAVRDELIETAIVLQGLAQRLLRCDPVFRDPAVALLKLSSATAAQIRAMKLANPGNSDKGSQTLMLYFPSIKRQMMSVPGTMRAPVVAGRIVRGECSLVPGEDDQDDEDASEGGDPD